jgi:hypothetical protein
MTAHVLAYLPRIPRLVAAEFRQYPGRYPDRDRDPRRYAGRDPGGYPSRDSGRYTARAAAVLGGRGVRLALLIASLLAGLVIAALTVHLAAPWHLARFGN